MLDRLTNFDKTCVCTHGADNDGIGSYIFFRYFNFPHLKWFPIPDYNFRDDQALIEQISNFDNIIFADISPNFQNLEFFINKGCKVWVLDHHLSSFEELSIFKHENFHLIHNMGLSGTGIVYRELSKGKRVAKCAHTFMSYVDTYDLWKEDHELWDQGQNANRVFFGSLTYYNEGEAKFKFYIDKVVNKLKSGLDFKWDLKELEIIEKAKKSEFEVLLEAKKRLKIREDSKGKKFGITFISKKISIVASNILNEMKDLQYLIIVNTYDKGDSKPWTKVSLRSKVCNVTELLGINGHEKAGGGEFDSKFLINLYKGLEPELGYKPREEISEVEIKIETFENGDTKSILRVDKI